MNTHIKKPTLETRCSHGGIQRGTPEYYEAIDRALKRLKYPTLKEREQQQYQAMQTTQQVEPGKVWGESKPKREVECGNPKCKKIFDAPNSRGRYCSIECGAEVNRLKERGRYRKAQAAKGMPVKDHAPKVHPWRTMTCKHCGESFDTNVPGSRYCHDRCQHAARQERRAKNGWK